MNQINSCPECGKLIATKTKRCTCGWWSAEPTQNARSDFRCSYVIRDRRCPLDGTMCYFPYGNGPWYCSGHWRTLNDPQDAEIVLRDAENNYSKILQKKVDWRRTLFNKNLQEKK